MAAASSTDPRAQPLAGADPETATPMERLWARFVVKAMFIILKIRRRSTFSIHEEVEMRRFFDAETSSSSSAGPEPPQPLAGHGTSDMAT